jgi:hypothetical protein
LSHSEFCQPIVGNRIGPALCLGPAARDDHRHRIDADQLGRLNAAMAGDAGKPRVYIDRS